MISGGAMWKSMYGHTFSFGQSIGFTCVLYISVMARMLQSSGTAFNGWVFLAFYSVITAMLLMYYLSSLRSSRAVTIATPCCHEGLARPWTTLGLDACIVSPLQPWQLLWRRVVQSPSVGKLRLEILACMPAVLFVRVSTVCQRSSR